MSTATLPMVLSNGFDVDAVCSAVKQRNATQEQVLAAAVSRRRAGSLDSMAVLKLLAGKALTDTQASTLLDMGKARAPGALSCKVSQKGALSVYGLQRMPVTLYSQQWDRLLNFAGEIRDFAEAHADVLSVK